MIEKENGHIGMNGKEEMQKAIEFMHKHFDLFTEEQIKGIYAQLAMYLKVDFRATVVYCGADVEKLKPLYMPAIKMTLKGLKEGENVFNEIIIDWKEIEACKVPDYQPFKIKEY